MRYVTNYIGYATHTVGISVSQTKRQATKKKKKKTILKKINQKQQNNITQQTFYF